MNEELEIIVLGTKDSMELSVDHLKKELLKIRAGKANPVMLNSISVDYYGTLTPLNQIANINSPDARTLTIVPWEKSFLPEIEKAIIVSNIGFNPMNNGESIIINVPPLTEERRKDLAKLAKSESEKAKISIRNFRKEANMEIKKSEASEDEQNNYVIDIQNITDSFVNEIDQIFNSKEKEILTI
jgi:ribosome recycling factor